MGDIGKPQRRIELEPMPDDVPVQEPSPAVAPAEPEKVPAGHASYDAMIWPNGRLVILGGLVT